MNAEPKPGEEEGDAVRCRTRSGAIIKEPTQLQDVNGIIPEENEHSPLTESTGFSLDNVNSDSNSWYELVSETEEADLEFTDILDMDQTDSSDRRFPVSRSRLISATDALIQAFILRLEYVMVNIAEYPPALTFVR